MEDTNITVKSAKEIFYMLIMSISEVDASPLFYGYYIDKMFDESPKAAHDAALKQYKRGCITFKEYDLLRKIINTGCNGWFLN